ncbi:MAG: helix-turn-helix domain-containing protein [Pseudomonadota bacterium]
MDQIIFSPKSLGTAIKRQRKSKGLNQNQAGQEFKLDQTTISSIEQGAPGTRIETLFRMLAALDLEMIIRPKKISEIANEDNW